MEGVDERREGVRAVQRRKEKGIATGSREGRMRERERGEVVFGAKTELYCSSPPPPRPPPPLSSAPSRAPSCQPPWTPSCG